AAPPCGDWPPVHLSSCPFYRLWLEDSEPPVSTRQFFHLVCLTCVVRSSTSEPTLRLLLFDLFLSLINLLSKLFFQRSVPPLLRLAASHPGPAPIGSDFCAQVSCSFIS